MRMTPELLGTRDSFEQWQVAEKSRLLILSGRTQAEARAGQGYTHSWLSPAALFVAEQKRREGHPAIFYSFHPSERPGHELSGVHMISTIVLRILELKPAMLREQEHQLRSIVHDQEWQNPESDRVAFVAACRLLREVLSGVGGVGPFFLVLDRIELCNVKLARLLVELTRLIVVSPQQIKILAVIDSAQDDWDLDHFDDDALLSRVTVERRWNQRKLSVLNLHQVMPPLVRDDASPTSEDAISPSSAKGSSSALALQTTQDQ